MCRSAAPPAAAARATWLAAAVLSRWARSGSDSQPSTSVQAAQCTTASGRRSANHCSVRSRSARSQSARRCATTSWVAGKRATTARPSMPAAPVTTTRDRAGSGKLDLTVVAHHELERLGPYVGARDAHVATEQAALDARARTDDLRRLEHDAVLDLAVLDAALRPDRREGTDVAAAHDRPGAQDERPAQDAR